MRAVVALLLSLLLVSSALGESSEREMVRAAALVKARCSLCHGMKGESVSFQYPKLAGQHAEYLVKQLFTFKTGERPSVVMHKMTSDLSASEIEMLGRYFSRQVPAAGAIDDPELAVVGRYVYFKGNRWNQVSACVECHGVYAGGGALMPRLAGQTAAYLESRLLEGKQPGRRDQLAAMHSTVVQLSLLEIKAVAQYLSGQE